jgi:hypothetical protein
VQHRSSQSNNAPVSQQVTTKPEYSDLKEAKVSPQSHHAEKSQDINSTTTSDSSEYKIKPSTSTKNTQKQPLQQVETRPISSESRVTSSGIQQVTTKAVSDKQEPDSTSNSTSDPNTDTDSKG